MRLVQAIIQTRTRSVPTPPSMVTVTAAKRRNMAEDDDSQRQPLLPGLPDHLAQLCLSHVPATLLYSVCRSWQRLIYTPSFPPFLSIYALLSSSSHLPSSLQSSPLFNSNDICEYPNQGSSNNHYHHPIGFFSFDPISAAWVPLPSPPPDPPLSLLLFNHPSFISRHLPVQSVALSGQLVVLAATTHHLLPALPRPLVFHPISNTWCLGPPIPTPRRWCAAGSVREAVYVASGVGAEYRAGVARCAERWDLKRKAEAWKRVAPLRDGRFSREAVEAVGLRGKLCVVDVKAKKGAAYDVDGDRWEDMPEGLLDGWRSATTSMDEEVAYTVDEEGSVGVLREYNFDRDCWFEVMRSEHLKGATQIAAAGGKVCAVCTGGMGIVVVDVVAKPPSMWLVNPPPATRVVTLHVLPRITQQPPK